MSETGRRLKELREAARISQDALGKAIGKNQRWVSYRERGVARISVEEAKLIANSLGKSAGLVIADDIGAFLEAVEGAPPADVEAAALLLRALPHMDQQLREMVIAMFEMALEKGEKRAAG